MPAPQVKDYTKQELRAIFANPGIDTNSPEALDIARKVTKQRFYKMVIPVVLLDCKKLISEKDFKNLKIVPHPIVKKLFDKLIA